jgi:hypothetical protein
MTMDMRFGLPTSDLASSYEPTADYAQIFKWGDVSIRAQSTTYAAPLWTVVLSIRNVATEVATITITNVTTFTWHFLKVHVKLDAATGLIEASVDGIAQSASYTGQNTVATTVLASAPYIYFGPPIFDNATNAYAANQIDNVLFDDAAFPAGRPYGERVAISNETADGWTAVGSGASTLVDALSSPLDVKAARGPLGGLARFDIPVFEDVNLETDMVGFNLYGKRAATRSTTKPLTLNPVVIQDGSPLIPNIGNAGSYLPIGEVVTHPETNNLFVFSGAYTGKGSAKIPSASIASGDIQMGLFCNVGPLALTATVGLELWLDASVLTGSDGSTVETWTDLSGNSRSPTQPTVGDRPTLQVAERNGLSALYFGGTDILNLASQNVGTWAVTTNFTAMVVAKRDAGAGVIYSFDNGVEEFNFYPYVAGDLNVDCGDVASGGRVTDTIADVTTWTVWFLVRNGNDLVVYQDGVSVATGTFSDNMASGSGTFSIGSGFEGHMGEVAIWGVALSAATLEDLFARAAAKWGI